MRNSSTLPVNSTDTLVQNSRTTSQLKCKLLQKVCRGIISAYFRTMLSWIWSGDPIYSLTGAVLFVRDANQTLGMPNMYEHMTQYVINIF